MRTPKRAPGATAALTLLACALQIFPNAASAKIYCWKSAAGRPECGDKPPTDTQVRELNERGVTVNTRDAALTPEQLRQREAEAARLKIERARVEQQQRKDRALLETFTTEPEIEAKRKRELGGIEAQIETLDLTLRNANERYAQATQRIDRYRKGTGKVPVSAQQEVDQIDDLKRSLNSQLGRKRKEIDDINVYYADMRKRFLELTAGNPPGATPGVTTPASSSSK